MIGSRKPLGLANAQPFRPAPMAMDGLLQTPKIKKPGFGSNGELGQLGALLLSASGNPAGQALMQMQARRQEAEREQQNYQRRLDDQWSMWERKEKWERENPAPRAPSEFERTLEAAGIAPGTPEWATYMRKRAENLANPMVALDVAQPDGSVRREFIRPGAANNAPPAGHVEDGFRFKGGDPADPLSWEPVGGPTPPASGTFQP